MIIDRAVFQVFPMLVCKNKAERVAPCRARRKPPLHLLYPLSFQNLDNTGGNGYSALFPVFHFIKENISTVTIGLLDLMADSEQPGVQINVRPPQADDFRLSQPREQVNDKDPLEAVPLDGLQEPTDVKLLDIVQPSDTIIATEVSRITRSTKQLCDIIEFAKEKHIKLVLGSFIVDYSKELDPMTEGMLKMMGVFAELERNMISQRVKSGMENAKSKGRPIGRPPVTKDNIPNIFHKHYPKYKNGELNKKELSRPCSLSYPTVYKYLHIIEL